jgi:hypothetical protein
MAKNPTASSGKIGIPQPAHPDRRQQPLPWHRPKSPDDDPDAPSRVRAILASRSYLLAEQDLAFLARDEARGVRLQIEYLKPETLLQEHAIRDTVVVYGSTRIPEPAEHGLGYLQLQASSQLDTTLSFASLLIIAGMGVVTFWALEVVERHAVFQREAAK